MDEPCIILLVADSEDDEAVYRRFLQRTDRYCHRLVGYASVSEAVSQSLAEKPDVILLDSQSVDRAQVTQASQLAQQFAGEPVPIVVLLEHGDPAIVAQVLSQGVQDYLIKANLTAELLCRTVQCVVEQQRFAQQLQQSREQAQRELEQRQQTEARLQQLQQELELRVRQRTHELERSQTILSQREQTMLKALEKERELGELKSRFVSMISHEFRTPLTTIQSATELLDYYKWTEDERQEWFQQIYQSIQHLTQLLDDVLLFGKVEANQLVLQPESIQLSELCESLVVEFRSLSGQDQRLTWTIAGPAQPVWLDAKLLRQILGNLLSNAIKYTPSQQPIHFQLEYLRDQVRFWVQDKGIGIPDADQARIFEAFFRATNVETIQGTGLGLAIVKRCVELQGGHISVQSRVGIGTRFLITLPLKLPVNAGPADR